MSFAEPALKGTMIEIPLVVSNQSDLELQDYLNLLLYSSARQAIRLGMDPLEALALNRHVASPSTSTVASWAPASSRPSPVPPTSLPSSMASGPGAATHSSPDSFASAGGRPTASVFATIPSTDPVPALDNTMSPLTIEQRAVPLQPFSSSALGLMCLTFEFTTGDFTPSDPAGQVWMDAMLDTGSFSTWDLHPKFSVYEELKDNQNKKTGDLIVLDRAKFDVTRRCDAWQGEKIPEVPLTKHEGKTYAAGQRYWYTPVSAPLHVSKRDNMHFTKLLADFHYDLAVALNPIMANLGGFDAIFGFGPQRYERQPAGGAARQTFINQLRRENRLSLSLKVFVISPSYKPNVYSMLYIGEAQWPQSIDDPGLQYPFDHSSKVTVNVFSQAFTKHGDGGWFVKLSEIGICDQDGSQQEVLWSGELITALDTGAEMAYLPDEFLDALIASKIGEAEKHVSRAGQVYYDIDRKRLNRSKWLYLKFNAQTPAGEPVLVAPLDEALAHRKARSDGDRVGLPVCPSSDLPELSMCGLIGLSWLKFFWISFQENAPFDAKVVLAKDIRRKTTA